MATERWCKYMRMIIIALILVNFFIFKIKQGFEEHLVSTASEWIFSILLMIFLLTFVIDFRKIKIQHPVVIDSSYNENTIENKI